MEYLEGIDLENLVSKHGPLPQARALAILRMAAASLAEAHAAGLVHRDIKPANIMLTCRGVQADVVKVVDFGLVKSAGGGTGSANLTAEGIIVGTPRYLAPEAIENPETIDARADVHALGAVAYYLVTGEPPFTGDTMIALLKAVAVATPKLPSQRGAKLSPGFEGIIMRCLAKTPGGRPKDAGELLDLLEEVTDVPAWTRAEARSWWLAHPPTGKPQPTEMLPTPTAAARTGQATGLGWLAGGSGGVTAKMDGSGSPPVG